MSGLGDLACTAAVEFAITVVATYGQALAGVVGPRIEMTVLVALKASVVTAPFLVATRE